MRRNHCRPGFIARKLCPELIFVKPDFTKYSKASQAVQAIFREYDPDVDAASMDEAYMDVTACCESRSISGLDAMKTLLTAHYYHLDSLTSLRHVLTAPVKSALKILPLF